MWILVAGIDRLVVTTYIAQRTMQRFHFGYIFTNEKRPDFASAIYRGTTLDMAIFMIKGVQDEWDIVLRHGPRKGIKTIVVWEDFAPRYPGFVEIPFVDFNFDEIMEYAQYPVISAEPHLF